MFGPDRSVCRQSIWIDIKFTLHRAEFNIQNTGYLYMKEKSLGYEKLSGLSIETSALADPSASSMLFKNNNSILKIYHPNHGFEDGSNSYVFFDTSEERQISILEGMGISFTSKDYVAGK